MTGSAPKKILILTADGDDSNIVSGRARNMRDLDIEAMPLGTWLNDRKETVIVRKKTAAGGGDEQFCRVSRKKIREWLQTEAARHDLVVIDAEPPSSTRKREYTGIHLMQDILAVCREDGKEPPTRFALCNLHTPKLVLVESLRPRVEVWMHPAAENGAAVANKYAHLETKIREALGLPEPEPVKSAPALRRRGPITRVNKDLNQAGPGRG